MAITSSAIIEDRAQIDGRRWITERHTDNLGIQRFVQYLAEAGADVQAAMSERLTQFIADIKKREIDRAIANALEDGPAVSPTLNWNTNTEFGLALREFYKTANQRNACRIGWYVTQFNLTDNQLRTFFGLTAGQVTAARAKLNALSDQYTSLLAAVGE